MSLVVSKILSYVHCILFCQAFGAAGDKWTAALCQADSDTDGKTNGAELGDPNCTWQAGQPVSGEATGHPGKNVQSIQHVFTTCIVCFT